MSFQSESIQVICPAKLNLGLKILSKMPEGHHYLTSIFLPINLSDEMHVEFDEYVEPGTNQEQQSFLMPELSFSSSLPEYFQEHIRQGFENPQLNTITKALMIYTEEYRRMTNFLPQLPSKIHIIKKIPSPGGLGGGSSNAGSLIALLLSQLENDIQKKMIQVMRARLLVAGADIPFFLNPQPALVVDKGHVLQYFKLPVIHGIIGIPPFGFSTSTMFKSLKKDLQPEKKMNDAQSHAFAEAAGFLKKLGAQQINNSLTTGSDYQSERQLWYRAWENDSQGTLPINEFVDAAKKVHPAEADRLLGYMSVLEREAGGLVGMTGSGASFFALTGTQLSGVVERLRAKITDVLWFPFTSYNGP